MNSSDVFHFYFIVDRTVLLWYPKEFTSKDRKSLRINIEFDHATLIRWSPDGKAFIIHKAVANVIEVYKIAKKSDGHLSSATKVLEFPRVLYLFDMLLLFNIILLTLINLLIELIL